MVLICDRLVTERAKNLRERMLTGGIPAAVSALSSIRPFLPVRLLVTFTDVFDDLRRLPTDPIFCIAIGQGFVNSALHAVRVDSEEEAIRAVRQHLALENDAGFGSHLTPEIFRGPGFYEIRGHTIVFTAYEERLFLCLVFAQGRCVTPEMIRAFCSPGDREGPADGANGIAVHVHHLNAKLTPALGERPIREKRFFGYYLKGI